MALPLVTGTNNSAKQVSVDAWNAVINKINATVSVFDGATSAERAAIIAGTSTDDTALVQAALDALPVNGVLDGQGGRYVVGNLWLKSNMVMQNFNLTTKAGALTDVSPVNIGNDLATVDGSHNSAAAVAAYTASQTAPGIQNVTLRNVHVNGNRSLQTCFDGDGQATRDGGLHGFCIKGFNTNITLENCSALYCGTDGILNYVGLHTATVSETNLCTNNLVVSNSRFQWNRRHGGAGDSIDGATFDNCQFIDNGQDINGGVVQGDKGATVLSGTYVPYANGYDMEGYGLGSRVTDVAFVNCDLLRNVRDGLLFYDIADQDAVGFVARDNIRITGGHIDCGTNNVNGDYAISMTSTIPNRAKAPLHNDIIISGTLIDGSILLRSVDNAMISGVVQNVTEAYRATLDYATNIRLVGNQSNIKAFFASNSSYHSDDGFYYATVTWNPGAIAAGATANTTITVAGAEYGDLVQLGHTELNTALLAGLILSGFVVFPEGVVQASIFNPTAGSKTIGSGTLKVRVSKHDAG